MKNFDIFLVQKLINLLNKYILFRKKTTDKNSDEFWAKLFISDEEKFVYKIDTDIKINLYKDSILSKLIYKGFEDEEKRFITKFIKPGDIFFDIGSNIGLHTLFAANALKNSGYIYAFEPTPSVYNRLKENIILNNWKSNINTFNIGLSNQNEQLTFNISHNGYDAWNSFADLKHVIFESQIQVDVMRFDTFINEKNIDYNKISLIKIDVEGWELSVLQGMETLFAKNDFNACFLIEFTEENTFRAGYSCRDLYNYMLNRGYEWFNYDLKTEQIKPAQLKAYYPYENLIAIKKQKIPFVKKRLNMLHED